MAGLDKLYAAILDVLQRDVRMPQRSIGELVGLSTPAVQRRIRRMEDEGIITASVAVVDPQKTGNSVTLIVEVEVQDERMELLEQTKTKFLAAPEVQQCYYTTGETDFVLIIITPSMEAYEQLTQRLFFSNSNVKKFKTLVVMNRLKTSQVIPLL